MADAPQDYSFLLASPGVAGATHVASRLYQLLLEDEETRGALQQLFAAADHLKEVVKPQIPHIAAELMREVLEGYRG